MTEDEYIIATNLAKLRIAEEALRSVLPRGEQEELRFRAAVREISWLRQRHEGHVERAHTRS